MSDSIQCIGFDAGGFGVFVPHDLAWDFETAEASVGHPRYAALPDLSALPDFLSDRR